MAHTSLGGDANMDEFCGTTQTAKMLGVSVGTVQSLVNSGELVAWKTKGGHRRISKKVILDYQVRHQMVKQGGSDDLFRVVVATRDAETLATLKLHFLNSDAKLNLEFFDSAIEMQMELQSIHPRLLMLDYASLETIGGIDWLRAFRKHPRYKHVAVVLLCKKEHHNVQLEGQALTHQIKLLELPLDVAWLKGYLDAVLRDE